MNRRFKSPAPQECGHSLGRARTLSVNVSSPRRAHDEERIRHVTEFLLSPIQWSSSGSSEPHLRGISSREAALARRPLQRGGGPPRGVAGGAPNPSGLHGRTRSRTLQAFSKNSYPSCTQEVIARFDVTFSGGAERDQASRAGRGR